MSSPKLIINETNENKDDRKSTTTPSSKPKTTTVKLKPPEKNQNPKQTKKRKTTTNTKQQEDDKKLRGYWVKLAEKTKNEEKKTEASKEAQNCSSKPAPGILKTTTTGSGQSTVVHTGTDYAQSSPQYSRGAGQNSEKVSNTDQVDSGLERLVTK